MIIVGGVVPKKDYKLLFDMGVAAVFGPGTVISEAAQDIIKIMLKGFLKNGNKKSKKIILNNWNILAKYLLLERSYWRK